MSVLRRIGAWIADEWGSRELMLFVGTALAGYGAGLVYLPAGFLVAGLLLAGVAILGVRG
jgi:hypothetical protein